VINLTNTVTLLSDHLGSDKPRVMGIEYTVDAVINVTDFDQSDATIVGNFIAVANNFTRTSGGALDTNFIVGQNLIIANAVDAGNNATTTFVSLVGEVLTVAAIAADETGDTITLSTDQEVIAYADFGLSTVSQVSILGQENALLNWSVELGTDGNSKIANHLVLKCITSSTGAQATGDCGTIRIRLVGQI
jgi:hypothetical protein